MRAVAVFAVLVGLGLAVPAAAQTSAETPAPAAETKRDAATGKADRVICRTQGATGSRLGGAKICKTAREWEAQRQGAKQETERQQRPYGWSAG